MSRADWKVGRGCANPRRGEKSQPSPPFTAALDPCTPPYACIRLRGTPCLGVGYVSCGKAFIKGYWFCVGLGGGGQQQQQQPDVCKTGLNLSNLSIWVLVTMTAKNVLVVVVSTTVIEKTSRWVVVSTVPRQSP